MNKKYRLPAITVEIPRFGMVVYVSELMGKQDGKPTAMFTAEIVVKGEKELQSFHLKCKDEKEAKAKTKEMLKRLKETGSYPFIQTGM